MIARPSYRILILLFLVLVSCQDIQKTKKPDDLIPEDKMVDLLTELSLVNAARNFNKFKLEKTGIEPEKYIYEKFGVDSLQFERSNAWYAEQYTQYERIYDSVKSRIQVMKSKLDSVMDSERRIEDSLKLVEKDSLLQSRDSLKFLKDSLRIKDSIRINDTIIKRPKVLVQDSLMENPPKMNSSRKKRS